LLMVPISDRQCCPVCRGRGHMEGRRPCNVCHGDGSLSRSGRYFVPNYYERLRFHPWLWKALRTAIDASNADFGNIQLYDSTNRALRIVAHRGFEREFLRYFAEVRAGHAACGAAMKTLRRIVSPDVATDPVFRSDATCEVMRRARVQAVQSTPLISSHGHFMGVISTHYRRAGSPPRRELLELDSVTRDLVAKIEAHLLGSSTRESAAAF
jgi:GAF domain-containing protein